MNSLEGKVWYRSLKVVYLLSFIIIFLFGILAISISNYVSDYEVLTKLEKEKPQMQDAINEAFNRGAEATQILAEIERQNTDFEINEYRDEIRLNRKIKNGFIFIISLLLIFEVIRRVFFYIILGKQK